MFGKELAGGGVVEAKVPGGGFGLVERPLADGEGSAVGRPGERGGFAVNQRDRADVLAGGGLPGADLRAGGDGNRRAIRRPGDAARR